VREHIEGQGSLPDESPHIRTRVYTLVERYLLQIGRSPYTQ